MTTKKYTGELEIDSERGVMYFHLTNVDDMRAVQGITLVRICRLPTPVPTDEFIDITFGKEGGASW